MPEVFAVIGANFGDEGKGLLTDYLCAGHAPGRVLVIRFNGGAQAGHTVVRAGQRHVFHHFGSGTLAGADTYLSQFFIANPMLWRKEADELGEVPPTDMHPDALLTTPWDVLLNQLYERKQAEARHGSCGVGINETVLRCRCTPFRTTVADIKNPRMLYSRLRDIPYGYVRARAEEIGVKLPDFAWSPSLIERFVLDCDYLRATCWIGVTPFRQYKRLVFEGAQGLLLDEAHPYFPYVTWGKTGLDNVKTILAGQNLEPEVQPVYVTRSYLTRHGPGPFPTEDPTLSYPDNTNGNNEFQGPLRFGTLNVEELTDRATVDASKMGLDPCFAVTHLDQRDNTALQDLARYQSFGPSRAHVRETVQQERVL